MLLKVFRPDLFSFDRVPFCPFAMFHRNSLSFVILENLLQSAVKIQLFFMASPQPHRRRVLVRLFRHHWRFLKIMRGRRRRRFLPFQPFRTPGIGAGLRAIFQ